MKSIWLTTGSCCPRCRSADIRARGSGAVAVRCEAWICMACREVFFRLMDR